MNANTTVRNEIALIVLLEIHALIVQTMTENMTDAILMVDAERRQRMGDLISRQAAIDAMAELQGRASTKAELKGISKAWKRIKQLPPTQPALDEFCLTCKEYDQERHCCPRFNRVIRKTVEEVKQNAEAEPRWIPVEERKPLICSNILVTDFDSVEEAYFSSDGHWFDLLGNKLKGVTAWMPLPESYRGE